MEKTKKDLVYDLLIGEDINDVENILKENGYEVHFDDEKIDDGTDEDGVYTMMTSYDVDELYVRIYWTNDDYKITFIDIR